MAVRPQRGPRGRAPAAFDDEQGIEDTVVKLYRCATVVKGGRRFSFGALVVVGDRRGRIGFGYGKANEVPPAVEKGIKQAKRAMFDVPLRGTTIPHRIVGRFGSSRVQLVPAAGGTGVIAGAAPRAVLELAGVKDVLTKCYGSTSPKNLVKATIDGLRKLRARAVVEALRGITLDLPPEPEPEPEPEPKPTPEVEQRGPRRGPQRGPRRGPRREPAGRTETRTPPPPRAAESPAAAETPPEAAPTEKPAAEPEAPNAEDRPS
jgi:small subunit ribosomal protein S5